MSVTAYDVVNRARKYIGAEEGSVYHTEIIRSYNSIKPLPRGYKLKLTDAWCAAFISAIGQQLEASEILLPECSCVKMLDKYRKAGLWIEDEDITPETGWIIFYDWQDNGVGNNTGNPDHVGIVDRVSNNYITIIEGNKNDKVGNRVLTRNAKYIRGYATPKYENSAILDESYYNLLTVAREVIKGKYGNGVERRRALTLSGYDYEKVQQFVNSILRGEITNA